MILYPGITFLSKSPGTIVEHLWIVITQKDKYGKVIAVNISSSSMSFQDSTVILEPREHPFIVRRSAVRYSDAKMVDVKTFENARLQSPSMIRMMEPCHRELLKRIQDGALRSEYIPQHLWEQCKNSWNS